jgi:hypothetical protein
MMDRKFQNEPAGKREAQQRADRIRAFREELTELEREGVLVLDAERRDALDTHLQHTLAALAERFDVDTSESQKQISAGMRIASTLGGIALCAAAVLFFHRVWGLLGVPAQVTVLVATPLLLLTATEFAARRERTLYYASLVSLVAFGSFVMNLSVLGNIFNLTPGRGALVAWGAFALLLAYTYRLRIVLVAGLVCVVGYLATTLCTLLVGNWQSFLERPENFLPGAILLILVPLAVIHKRYAEFNPLYRICGALTLFLAILIVSESGAVSYLPMRYSTIEVMYQLSGLAAAAVAVWVGTRVRGNGDAAVANLGAGFFAILLFLRFYHWWWHWMPGYVFFLIIGVVSIGLLAMFQKLRARAEEAVAP